MRSSDTWRCYRPQQRARLRTLTYETLETRRLLTIWGPHLDFSTWNQNPSPYWDDTPLDPTTGQPAYVGCVATAAAQVLSYWRHPDDIEFSLADRYVTHTRSIDVDGDAVPSQFPTLATLDAELSEINYDQSDDEKAVLGFGVGVKYEMDYTSRGSGAFTSWGEDVFTDDFGYGSARWGAWSSQVETAVIDNLKSGWPVILAVGRSGARSGHSLVLEGYRDDTDEFYVNFGWGGGADGWYDLPDLDTPTGYSDYDIVRGAVYDINPSYGWGQTLGDAENTSFSPYAVPETSTEKWRQTTDGDHKFEGILAGMGSNVYVANTTTSPGPASSLWVVTDTGVKIDEIPLPESIDDNNGIGYPAQAPNGNIFIPTDEGAVYRVDPETRTVTKIFQDSAYDQMRSVKIDENGLLYVATFSKLYCLNQDGTQQWAYQVPSSGRILRDEPAVDDVRNLVYLPYYRSSPKTSHLAMIDRTNGDLLHTEDFGGVSFGSYSAGTPSIGSDGTVYIGNYTTLYALNPDATLSEKWHKDKYPSLMYHAPTVGRDGTLYVKYWKPNLTDQVVAALYADTGNVKWEIPFQLGDSDNIGSILAGSNDMIAFGIGWENGSNPDTYAVYTYRDLGSSYQKVWQKDFGTSGGNIALGPENTLYVMPASGYGHTITALGSGIGMGRENNSAPDRAVNTGVPDFGTVADVSAVLSWETSDPEGHDIEYTLWIRETENDYEYVAASGITQNSYTVSDLAPGTQYSWYVIASDGQAFSKSEEWTFSTASASGALVTTIVSEPTAFEDQDTGEVGALPSDEEWIDEWASFYVEVWVSTPDTNDAGVLSAQLDLTYNTDYFTATAIEHGPGFDLLRVGTIDDSAGLVDDLGAGTLSTDVGDDRYALLARVSFDPTEDNPNVLHNADGKYITPLDTGFGLDDPEVMLVGPIPAAVELGDAPDTELWPAMYDIDDDGRNGFGDFAFFATAFQQNVGDPGATYAWAADFDHSGRVDSGDFAWFATNFQRTKTGGIPLDYHQDFPEAWRPSPLMLEMTAAPPQGSAALLTEDKFDAIVAEAVHRIEKSAGSEAGAVLESVTVEIVDLPGNRLGQSLDNRVWIDVDASGYGWFIDATPGDDVEFWHRGATDEQMATLGSPARGRVDLLTTVMHELGHVLGLEHTDDSGVMNALLPLSTRRLFDDDFLPIEEWQNVADSWDAVDAIFGSFGSSV